MARITEKNLRFRIDCINGVSNHNFILGHNGYGYSVMDEASAALVDSGMTAKECYALLTGMLSVYSLERNGHV